MENTLEEQNKLRVDKSPTHVIEAKDGRNIHLHSCLLCGTGLDEHQHSRVPGICTSCS